jgi:hypothetical protein
MDYKAKIINLLEEADNKSTTALEKQFVGKLLRGFIVGLEYGTVSFCHSFPFCKA